MRTTEREPGKEYILSLSYGKDSLACLGAIEQIGWPLDRIVHAEVWATDTIPADLPPMVEFKDKADEIIKQRWGIEVEHVCAMRNGEKITYEKLFYHEPTKKFRGGVYRGFAAKHRNWCLSYLKQPALRMAARHRRLVQQAQNPVCTAGQVSGEDGARSSKSRNGATFSNTRRAGREKNTVQYLGIASDEPERIIRHTKPGFELPLVAVGWNEAYCRRWCEENGLLSPIYTTSSRGGLLVLSQSRR